MSTEETAAYLKRKIDTPVHNGIDVYRAVYRTVRLDGGPTTASGLIVLPRTDSRRLCVVSYEHGTLVLESDAPSVNGQTRPDQARALQSPARSLYHVTMTRKALGTYMFRKCQ
jgi:hypothetical protein